jgi:hypothetical protein
MRYKEGVLSQGLLSAIYKRCAEKGMNAGEKPKSAAVRQRELARAKREASVIPEVRIKISKCSKLHEMSSSSRSSLPAVFR